MFSLSHCVFLFKIQEMICENSTYFGSAYFGEILQCCFTATLWLLTVIAVLQYCHF